MAKLVSKTYGDALFEVAAEENRMDALLDEDVYKRQGCCLNDNIPWYDTYSSTSNNAILNLLFAVTLCRPFLSKRKFSPAEIV